MTVEERQVDLPGGRTRVQIRGEGPALIWTHSMLHAIDVEDHTPIGPLLDGIDGYRVIRYDTRGHGGSAPGPDDAAHATHALGAELISLADALGIERFVAGGASMGCATTMHAAVMAPQRIERLVLLIPPTAWATRPAQQTLYRGTKEILCEGGKAPFMMMFQQAMRLRSLVPGFEPASETLLQTLTEWDSEALALVFGGNAGSDMPAREALEPLQIPAMIVSVDGDRSHPVSSAEGLQACLRNSVLTKLDRLDASVIAPLLRDFLAPAAAR